MTLKMTTERIIRNIENHTVPGEWDWEYALEQACADSSEDAADAARFLEKLHPGREWSAAEYHGLMYRHLSGRWSSVEEIAWYRLNEKYADDVDNADGDAVQLRRINKIHDGRTANDETAVKFLRDHPGTHVFDCADGTVLTFDGIFDNKIIPEEID